MAPTDPYDEEVIAEFRARGGIVAGRLAGLSLLLLHHVGAKSGAERVTPLAYWRIGHGALAVLASNYGAPRNPGWYHNLVAHPTTAAEIGADTWAVRARVAPPDERRRLIAGTAARTPSVAATIRTTRRPIPVVILDLIEQVPKARPRGAHGRRGETFSRR
jgi:deazaflavin-dependent oxidoreductase (nitroreductase family)